MSDNIGSDVKGYELLLGSNSTERYYAHLGAHYLGKFINNTPANTAAAFAVCYAFENEGFGDINLRKQFPMLRENYAQKLIRNEPAAKLLRQERQVLREEKTKLFDELEVIKIKGGTSGEEQDKSIVRQLTIRERTAEIDLRLKKVSSELGRLKPEYKPFYSLKNKRWKDRELEAEPDDWQTLQRWHQQKSAELSKIEPTNPLPKNLSALAEELGLSEIQKDVLLLILAHEKSNQLRGFIDYFAGKRQDGYHLVIARILKTESEEITDILHSSKDLVGYGLIVQNKENEMPKISPHLKNILSEPGTTIEGVLSDLMGKVVTTPLDWKVDFGGHGNKGGHLVRFLAATLEVGEKGAAIFFSGSPGVGKTVSAAALVKELSVRTGRKLELRLVGERIETQNAVTQTKRGGKKDDDHDSDDELNAQSRLSQVLIAKALVKKNPNVVLIVEEPDSMFPKAGAKVDAVERVAIQRLLEDRGLGLVIFTGNNWNFHEAVEQRIQQHLEFHPLSAKERTSVLSRLCERNHLPLSPEVSETLATRYNLPPRLMEQAVEYTALVAKHDTNCDHAKTLEHWMQARAQSIFGSIQAVYDGNHTTTNELFDVRFLNVTTNTPSADAMELIKKLAATEHHQRDFLILCEGHEGTGRRSFAWHFASQMGLEVLPINLSHMFGSAPGAIEMILEGSLQAAHDTKKLIFLEYNPERLGISQSDQMREIIHHINQPRLIPCPVIVSSPPSAGLEQDFGTQFAYVLKFDFLKPTQRYEAFEHFYGNKVPKGSLDSLDKLAIGDFGLLHKNAVRLGTISDTQALLENLITVNANKPRDQKPLRPNQTTIGFAAQLETMRQNAVARLQNIVDIDN